MARNLNWAKRQSPEFQEFIKDRIKIDPETGYIESATVYISSYATIGWKSATIAVPYAHLVFFLTHGRWPNSELHLDYIDDNSTNNKPDNLREITKKENYDKRRGKGYRNYGKNKYGFGINVYKDKRDGRYYADRYFSAKDIKELRQRKKHLFGAATLEEIEMKISDYIELVIVPTESSIDDLIDEIE